MCCGEVGHLLEQVFRLEIYPKAVNIARVLKTSVEYLVTKNDLNFKKDNSRTIALLEQAIESLK